MNKNWCVILNVIFFRLAQKDGQIVELRTALSKKEEELDQLGTQVESLRSEVNNQHSLTSTLRDDLEQQRTKNNVRNYFFFLLFSFQFLDYFKDQDSRMLPSLCAISSSKFPKNSLRLSVLTSFLPNHYLVNLIIKSSDHAFMITLFFFVLLTAGFAKKKLESDGSSKCSWESY